MRVRGAVRPPGDKSIPHRALLLAALAHGRSELDGLLTGADVKSRARVLGDLGGDVWPVRAGGPVLVRGRALARPAATLDCGNSGTRARLVLGALAGRPFATRLSGDASLRRRPMRRVTEPLRAMGAHIKEERGDSLPLTIRGGELRNFTYTSPVASAQIKSALLLAGLVGGVAGANPGTVPSPGHTQRALGPLGLPLHQHDRPLHLSPSAGTPSALPLSVPGDPFRAAVPVRRAVLAEGGELLIENVGVNPTRTGFLVVLGRMGARVERLNLRDEGGEPVADLLVRPAALRATEVAAAEVPTLVDEVPILAALASRATGETVFRQVGELRVKESNRLELVAANLRALGVAAEARAEDLFVRGTDRPPRGRVDTARDHRLAMAFAVLGTISGADVRLSERASVAISYPAFFADLR